MILLSSSICTSPPACLETNSLPRYVFASGKQEYLLANTTTAMRFPHSLNIQAHAADHRTGGKGASVTLTALLSKRAIIYLILGDLIFKHLLRELSSIGRILRLLGIEPHFHPLDTLAWPLLPILGRSR